MRFLSDEWLTAVDAAVRDAAASAPPGRLVIDQHIDQAMRYRIVIARDDAGAVRLDEATEPDEAADAIFHQSAETAVSIATGDTDAHQAFLLGRLAFSGDVDVLIERRHALDWLAATLEPVMARTTF